MLKKEELLAIQHGFAAKKLYAAGEAHTLELGLEAIVEFQLAELVRVHVKEAFEAAYAYLKKVIFAGVKAFLTAKEAYVHVMTVLGVLVVTAQ